MLHRLSLSGMAFKCTAGRTWNAGIDWILYLLWIMDWILAWWAVARVSPHAEGVTKCHNGRLVLLRA